MDLVRSITIETAFFPPIVIDQPFAPAASPSPVLSLLKPKISIQLIAGNPVVSEPWGDPGVTQWPVVQIVLLAAALALAGMLVYRLA